MSKVQLGKSEIIIPGTWDEFTPLQLEALASYSLKQLPVQTFKVYAMLFLLGLRPGRKVDKTDMERKSGHAEKEDGYEYYHKARRYILTPSQMVQMSHCLSWMFRMNDSDNSVMLDVKLRRCPYPKISGLHATLAGPGDGLERLTYEQFVWAQAYEQRLAEHPEDMAKLLACLWHRGKAFDPDRVEDDARIIAELPHAKIVVMYWLWVGTLNWFTRQFPHVFGGEGDGASGNVFEEQQKIIDALANGDVTRKPAVRQGLLYDTLFTMEQSLVRQQQAAAHR